MRRALVALVAVAALGALAGCYREKRDFDPPPLAASAPAVRQSALRPGGRDPADPPLQPVPPPNNYDENAYAVSQGKRFFRAYNCNGCHAQGGGDIGPPLMDAKWVYGSSPANIYSTIVEGRPNGMPSFGGRIAEDQIWQIVAYVRSLSGQLQKDVAPNRPDTLTAAPAESTRSKETPVPDPESASRPAK